MANRTDGIGKDDATSGASVARLDMKLEVIVIPVRMLSAPRSSTRSSGGDSTLTSRPVRTFA